MRAMAGFLRTKTEPRLYYKPWELTEDEEGRIKRQLQEVEETIAREKEKEKEKEKDEAGEKGDERQVDRDRERSKSPSRGERPDSRTGTNGGSHSTGEAGGSITTVDAVKDADGTIMTKPDVVTGDATTTPVPASDEASAAEKPEQEPKTVMETISNDKTVTNKEDDHGGEELEQGQEDDVIY
jgi:hypothetical protein